MVATGLTSNGRLAKRSSSYSILPIVIMPPVGDALMMMTSGFASRNTFREEWRAHEEGFLGISGGGDDALDVSIGVVSPVKIFREDAGESMFHQGPLSSVITRYFPSSSHIVRGDLKPML